MKTIVVAFGVLLSMLSRDGDSTKERTPWTDIPTVQMRGGLSVFWAVGGSQSKRHRKAAVAHGFQLSTALNTFADYPGKQKENIANFAKSALANPWAKPPFFERIVRRNIEARRPEGIFFHDIEILYSDDAEAAWENAQIRKLSGASSFPEFEKDYLKEWSTWFSLPLRWTKEIYPQTPVGLYGVQPFRRDFWGIAGKSASQIDGSHATDMELWRNIDRYVDYYIASIYAFYPTADSVFYMAANVEENYTRTKQFGDRPVYAFEWLRYHNANKWEKNREVDPWLAEAMAIVPWFSGAKGIVLWGSEPNDDRPDLAPYAVFDRYMRSLARVSKLSELIGRGNLVIDTPTYDLWTKRLPLVRKVVVGQDDCVVMAINPWQSDNETSSVETTCGSASLRVEMKGRAVTLLHSVGPAKTFF